MNSAYQDELPLSEIIDSEIFQSSLKSRPSIKVIDTAALNNKCAIYFTSHALYFPNTLKNFSYSIVEKDYFEWKKYLVPDTSRHILLRDPYKQFFINGIDSQFDTLEKLIAEISRLTKDYDTTAIGVSAGGYAAMLFTAILNFSRAISINGQYSLNEVISTERERAKNPIIVEKKNADESRYYEIADLIKTSPASYYSIMSRDSAEDKKQHTYISGSSKVKVIALNTDYHGIPCFSENIPGLLNATNQKLNALTANSPYTLKQFSRALDGNLKTFKYLVARRLSKLKAKSK